MALEPIDTAQGEAAQAQFSIRDYGREGDQKPYQIVQPAYDAPTFLKSFMYLDAALRECSTLCSLEGKPFRVVRWGREASGNKGGVPCAACAEQPRKRPPAPCSGAAGCYGCLHGYPNAVPIAECRPDGQHIVWGPNGSIQLVGRPNYIVSAAPFSVHFYNNQKPIRQNYLTAVKTAQYLASRTGKRTYVCNSSDCKTGPGLVPVVYVEPGGFAPFKDTTKTGTVTVKPVDASMFRELLAESRGATYLGQGA